jgi:integrase
MDLIYPDNPRYSGCYQRKGKNGLITYYIMLRIDGKQKKIKVGRADVDGLNPKSVKAYRDKLVHDGVLPENKRLRSDILTLDEGWEKFKEMLEATSDHPGPVVARYNKHIKPYIGHLPIDRITPVDIDMAHKGWIKSRLADSTQKQVWLNLSWIINWLIEKRIYLGKHPLEGIKPIGSKAQRDRFLPVDVSEDLLSVLKGMDQETYWKVALCKYLGLRPIELTRITPVSIDHHRGIITIRNAKSKKKNETRFVVITPEAESILKEIEQVLPRTKLDEPYFPAYCGNKGLSTRNYDIFRKACDKLGLNKGIKSNDRVSRVSPYTMRHTFASDLLESGSNLAEVQSMLGHKHVSTTMIYAHVAKEAEKRAAGRMSEMIQQARKEKKLKVVN